MSPRTAILGGLVALAASAPLPFGSVSLWAGGILACCVGALLAVWGAFVLRGSVPLVRPPNWFWWVSVPFLLALAWSAVQTLADVPAPLRNPVWEASVKALGSTGAGSVALDPAAARAGAIGIAACAGVFWLALQTGRDPARAAATLTGLGLAGAAYALYGLMVQFSDANTILWFPKTAYHDVVTATFVNRNTFATHAGLGLLCVVAALRESLDRGSAQGVPFGERLRRLIAERPGRKGLLLGAALLIGTALLLSESRGGTAASLVALTAFLSILALRRARVARAAGVAACAVAGGLLVASFGEGLERRLWSAEADWGERRQIIAQTLDAMRESPLRGAGLGGFDAAHRAHRKPGAATRVARAHNDYLEMALELGAPAALAFFAALGGLALACAAGALRRRRASSYPAAGFAACVLVGAHSLVDFSMQVPAVAVLFSLVLGIAVARSWGGGGGRHRGYRSIAPRRVRAESKPARMPGRVVSSERQPTGRKPDP